MKRRSVLILCCAAVIAAPFGIARFSGHRAVSERRLARKAGIPLTIAEFPMPQVAARDNAAPDYLALSVLLKRRPVTQSETKVLRSIEGRQSRPDAKTMAPIRRILNAHRDALGLIRSAAHKPAAVFPMDFETAMRNHEGPIPGEAFNSARFMLRAEAASLAADGRWDEAVRTQALGFRMASHAASAPTIVAFLVGTAADKTAIGGMTDLLTWAGPNERVSRAVIRAIEGNRPHYDVPRALKGEYLAWSCTLRSLRAQSAREKDKEVHLPRGIRLPEALKNEHDPIPNAVYSCWDSDLLHWLRPLIAAASLPMPQRQPAVRRIQKQVPTNVANPLHTFSAMMLPTLCDAPIYEIQAEARRSVALAAADTLIVVARTGRCPASAPFPMPGKVSAQRMDPWTGRAIGYRREADGFVVYSVGEHGTFDGRSQPGKGREAWFRWRR